MFIICTLLQLYLVAIFVRIVLSWFPLDPDGFMATVAGTRVLPQALDALWEQLTAAAGRMS